MSTCQNVNVMKSMTYKIGVSSVTTSARLFPRNPSRIETLAPLMQVLTSSTTLKKLLNSLTGHRLVAIRESGSVILLSGLPLQLYMIISRSFITSLFFRGLYKIFSLMGALETLQTQGLQGGVCSQVSICSHLFRGQNRPEHEATAQILRSRSQVFK